MLWISTAMAQDLQWAKQAGGVALDAGYGVAVDGSGNSYVTGRFQGTATFGLGEANQTILTAASIGFFVAKYDSSGALAWAKQAENASYDYGLDIAVDALGNSYVTGYFSGTATFGTGEANETILPTAGTNDIFVAKYDPNGMLIWAKRAGGADLDYGNGVAVDALGNSYVTGYFEGTATFGLGEANETILTAANTDLFVAKYDPNGMLLWARRAGGAYDDLGLGIAVDSSGNSYVTGNFLGTATFGLGEANETTLTSAGLSDLFVAKYDPNGMLIWARRAGGIDGDNGSDMAVDSSGNSYVTGNFLGTATFGLGEANETTLTSAGLGDIFLAKYASNGSLLWAKRAGGTDVDGGGGMAVDSSGNSYVTGNFRGTASFGPGEANETTLVSAGFSDIFLAKFSGGNKSPADFNGDGISDIGVYRDGGWYLDLNSNDQWDGCVDDGCFVFGLSGDQPVVGDWSHSGEAKIGVFRDGGWYLDLNGNNQWDPAPGCGIVFFYDGCFVFGLPGDQAVVGDWDGDGGAGIGVYRDGGWYLDLDGNNQWDGCEVDGCYVFGLSGDQAVVGDWTGSGQAKIGVYRDGGWYLDLDGNNQWDGCEVDGCYVFGLAGDIPAN